VRQDGRVTGVLAWGVKQSLLSYVTSAPGGQLLTTKDVRWEDGAFRFPLADSAPGADGESFDVEGVVRFHGHFSMLVAELSGLRITRGDAGWVLSLADGEDSRVDAFALDGEPERSGDGPGRLDWADVRLTEAGSEGFGGHYPPGTLFDPLAVIF